MSDATRRARQEPRRAYAQTDVHPGDTVAGRYQVDAVLGRSRGLLLDAHHTGFDQRVAVRVLSPALVDPRAMAQFEREARTLSKLDSEHVARILDFGKLHDGSLYLVRQYVDGISLAEHARRRGGLPLEEAVLFFLQVCEAVQAAHAGQVVLRDLQAEHVFLAAKSAGERVAKLTDFGTCKAVRALGEPGELTATKLLGLSSSASPELVRQDKSIDAKSDVWSLGCLLYELLTGRPPFVGEGAALMLAITNDEPPPLGRVRPHLPRVLDQILRWALAKDRERRFGGVYALSHELRPFADARGNLLIDRIGRLACPEGMRQPLAPPIAEMMAEDDDELTMVRSIPVRVAEPARAPVQVTPVARVLGPSFVPAAPSATVVPAPRAVLLALPEPNEAAPASDRVLRSGDFPWSTEVPPPHNHRRTVAVVWGTIVAMPLSALLLTLMLSQPTTLLLARAHMTSAVGADIDAHAALAAMDPESEKVTRVDGDALEGAVTAMVREEREADRQRKQEQEALKTSASQFLKSMESSTTPTSERGETPPQDKKNKKKQPRSERVRTESTAATGTLVAMAVGASCSFAVDGARRGSGSSIKTAVSAGAHSVSCTPLSGSSRTRSVTVEPGKASVAVFRF